MNHKNNIQPSFAHRMSGMKRKMCSKDTQENVKDCVLLSVVVIDQGIGCLWLGMAQGPPDGGTNSSEGWESGVNTSSLTDGPLHYINTAQRQRESREG